jgi:peptidoglycan/xylan/chitin deacetylase (PgdA/CDA1 family)
MYHRISNYAQGDEFYSGFEIGVSKENFEKQMQYIREKMNPISLKDLVECIIKSMTIPERAVAITFDDGYGDNYTIAYPILKRYKIPATIFLATGYIETSSIFWWDKVAEIIKKTKAPFIELKNFCSFSNDKAFLFETIALMGHKDKENAIMILVKLFKTFDYEKISNATEVLQDKLKVADTDIEKQPMLDWAQIEEMCKNGIDIGAHTVNHPDLTKINVEEVEEEICQSKKTIEERLNRQVSHFAYPYGLGENYNKNIERIAKNLDFQSICTAETGIVTIKSDVFNLKRVSMPNSSLSHSIWKICKYIRTNPSS